MARPNTHGLTESDLGKRLRIQLSSGYVEEVLALELTICDPPEPCCGLTYRLIRSRPACSSKTEGSVYWIGFGEITHVSPLGENLA
jgi:hypothetical protein